MVTIFNYFIFSYNMHSFLMLLLGHALVISISFFNPPLLTKIGSFLIFSKAPLSCHKINIKSHFLYAIYMYIFSFINIKTHFQLSVCYCLCFSFPVSLCYCLFSLIIFGSIKYVKVKPCKRYYKFQKHALC